MARFASRHRYPIDAELLLRDTGQAAVVESTNTDALPLERLTAYWGNDDLASNEEMVVVVNIEALSADHGQLYTALVQVDELVAFGSATALATFSFSTDGVYPVLISRNLIDALDPDSGFLRVRVTADDSAAFELGSIAFSDQPTAEDAVTIDDNSTSETFEFNNEVGTVLVDAAVADGAIVTIDDGVNDPIGFEFDDDATVSGSNISVDPGASVADAADNLAAAVQAQFVAGNLNVSAVSDTVSLVTLTNHGNAEASVVETADVGTDLTVTDFSVTLANGGATIVAIGATLAVTLANFLEQITAGALNVTGEIDGSTVELVNEESQAGSITEVTDDGAVITIVDFDVAPLSVVFSAWLAPVD